MADAGEFDNAEAVHVEIGEAFKARVNARRAAREQSPSSPLPKKSAPGKHRSA